jgi:peptidoglycan/LPS O-acetylase OafA/YrhL
VERPLVSQQTDSATGQPARLHYVDWLRVIAILMVFLFHAVHPFDFSDWHITNAELSMALTVILFILGFVLFADERFVRAIRRDRRLILAVAIVATAIPIAAFAFGDPFDWSETPSRPEFYLVWTLVTINAWCWTVFMLFVGMRFLDFTNRWLRYGQAAILPFFVVHQPVIIVIAFFVVQWTAGIPIKMLTVVLGSFVVSIGLYELVIKRIGLLRAVFGMKSKHHLSGVEALAGRPRRA